MTCLECERPHYVPRAADPRDQLATRDRREVTCRCGHAFTTRAKLQSATRCPDCRAMVWVRLDAPVVASDTRTAPTRTAERHSAPAARTSPAPRRQPAATPIRRPAPAPAPKRTPARASGTPAPGLLSMLGTMLGQATATRTSSAPRPPAPPRLPATPAATTVRRPAPLPPRPHGPTPHATPTNLAGWVARFGLELAPRNARPGGLAGYCVLASGREERWGRDCGAFRTHYIGFPDGSVAYVCEGHKDVMLRGSVRERIPITVAPLG